MKPRYFQIGFNRCGTASLHRFFRLNGFRSVHHDGGRLAIAMDANLRAGRPVLEGYGEFDAFFDMSYLRPHIHVEIYRRWGEILAQVPGARFILNLRDVDRWVASRMAMGPWVEFRGDRPARGFGAPWDAPYRAPVQRIAPFRERYRLCHGLADMEAVVAHWREDHARHVTAVRAGIPSDRLLVFDIERDPPEALCRFAGLDDRAARRWGHENAGYGTFGRAIAGWTPRSVSRRIPEALKRPVRRALRRR